jgi:hypothetical protein
MPDGQHDCDVENDLVAVARAANDNFGKDQIYVSNNNKCTCEN